MHFNKTKICHRPYGVLLPDCNIDNITPTNRCYLTIKHQFALAFNKCPNL